MIHEAGSRTLNGRRSIIGCLASSTRGPGPLISPNCVTGVRTCEKSEVRSMSAPNQSPLTSHESPSYSPLGYPTNLLAPGQTYETVNKTIAEIPLSRAPMSWRFGFFVAFLLLMMFLVAITWLFAKGVGICGVNIPVAWGLPIVNFVWGVGIGHAGTFISAILLLLFQHWRTAINRFTEAMTLFAVACAGSMPLLHLGRPWVFYWLFHIRIRWESGRNFVAHWFGTSLQSALILPYRRWFGISVSCQTWLRCVIAPRSFGKKKSMAFLRWDGAIPLRTGNAIRSHTCCSPDSPHRSFFQCTVWLAWISRSR